MAEYMCRSCGKMIDSEELDEHLQSVHAKAWGEAIDELYREFYGANAITD